MTKDVAALKTDAAVWAARIVKILDNLSYVEELAGKLREDLRTDRVTRQSHDNFYSQCLGIVTCISLFTDVLVWITAAKIDADNP